MRYWTPLEVPGTWGENFFDQKVDFFMHLGRVRAVQGPASRVSQGAPTPCFGVFGFPKYPRWDPKNLKILTVLNFESFLVILEAKTHNRGALGTFR